VPFLNPTVWQPKGAIVKQKKKKGKRKKKTDLQLHSANQFWWTQTWTLFLRIPLSATSPGHNKNKNHWLHFTLYIKLKKS
jgi:hypothetical protein